MPYRLRFSASTNDEIFVTVGASEGIDLALRAYDNWNNMASILNALIDDYKKQCLRDEAPAPKQARGVWRRRV